MSRIVSDGEGDDGWGAKDSIVLYRFSCVQGSLTQNSQIAILESIEFTEKFKKLTLTHSPLPPPTFST